MVAADLPALLALRNQRQDGMVLRGTDELDLPALRELAQAVDDVLGAAFVEHLGEDAVDVDARLRLRVLFLLRNLFRQDMHHPEDGDANYRPNDHHDPRDTVGDGVQRFPVEQ